MVRYSAVLNNEAIICHLSKYYDNINETDFVEELNKLQLSSEDFLKLKYTDDLGLKLTCVIKRADKHKFTLTESFRS